MNTGEDAPSETYLAHVRALVDQAPPLTATQRDRIRRILQPVIDARAKRATETNRPKRNAA